VEFRGGVIFLSVGGLGWGVVVGRGIHKGYRVYLGFGVILFVMGGIFFCFSLGCLVGIFFSVLVLWGCGGCLFVVGGGGVFASFLFESLLGIGGLLFWWFLVWYWMDYFCLCILFLQ